MVMRFTIYQNLTSCTSSLIMVTDGVQNNNYTSNTTGQVYEYQMRTGFEESSSVLVKIQTNGGNCPNF